MKKPMRDLAWGIAMTLGSTMSAGAASGGHDELLQLFGDWRAFERAPMRAGAPDYTASRMASAQRSLADFRRRLEAIDPQAWPVAQQVDWHVVRAEMNGFDFNCRVLAPWARDPAFYLTLFDEQSDVPAHEGPTNHATLEVWTYRFPLDAAAQEKMTAQLAVVPPLLAQARTNLGGNARDLWIGGIRTIEGQTKSLDRLGARVGEDASRELRDGIAKARAATVDFVAWLREQAPSKTGPSGVGRENYDWYQRNVRYVPLTWEDERRLLERELARSWSSLALEETRNRGLPELPAAATPGQFAQLADAAATKMMRFLRERRIVPIYANMEPALRQHLGSFVAADKRNFFDIGLHMDPLPLYSHMYHWFDLARFRDTPAANPIRRGPLLYNIFDSYSEGTATAVEEMFMHAGLYEDSPRSREIVWIMLAARAARGLGSLYAHANEMTMEQAGHVHVEWTPRRWMTIEPELLAFEQHLYLRQPGYGTSYVTGKYLLEQLMQERARQLENEGKTFVLEDFFREFQSTGAIPTALVRWQLTGKDDQVKAMMP